MQSSETRILARANVDERRAARTTTVQFREHSLFLLQALTLEPHHGLGVGRRVEQITQGAFRVNPGSLFPALHRLEEKGWLKSEWGLSAATGRPSTTA